MRILVSIANHGTKNLGYLERLLAAYRAMPFDVDLVVLSDAPKSLGSDVEVLVGAPTSNPWSLPFAHRTLFAERVDDYDLFIYSEDDTLIEERNVRAFLEVDRLLPEDEIPGFLRFERHPDGSISYCSVHSHYHWDTRSVEAAGGEVFARFTNLHSACYMVTRQQLRRAIASGGFLVPAHEGRYDMLVSAAVDPYQQCGFKKMICVSRVDDFLLHHLPNVYLGKLGITAAEWEVQLEALERCGRDELPSEPLFEPNPLLLADAWNKQYYEKPAAPLDELVPRDAERVLSIGCGSGDLEASLRLDSSEVWGIPIDAVIGAHAATRGLRVTSPDWEAAMAEIGARRFDCVLLVNVLQYLPDPVAMLRRAVGLLGKGGTLVAGVANLRAWSARRRLRAEPTRVSHGVPYETAHLRYTDLRALEGWFRDVGLRTERKAYTHVGRSAEVSRWTRGLFDDLLGRTVYVAGSADGGTGPR